MAHKFTPSSTEQILLNYQELTENEKAHVMVTLLDFMDQNLLEFNTRYGTIAQGMIKKLRPEGELQHEA